MALGTAPRRGEAQRFAHTRRPPGERREIKTRRPDQRPCPIPFLA